MGVLSTTTTCATRAGLSRGMRRTRGMCHDRANNEKRRKDVAELKGHGGKRKGAGRPKRFRMRRSDELAGRLISEGRCPVESLVRIAERAEAEGDLTQAIGAWKSVMPDI